jgi:hypothetical protein
LAKRNYEVDKIVPLMIAVAELTGKVGRYAGKVTASLSSSGSSPLLALWLRKKEGVW